MRYFWISCVLILFSCSKEETEVKEPVQPNPSSTLEKQEIIWSDSSDGLFHELFFLDDKLGFGLDPYGTEVLRTLDGGNTWLTILNDLDNSYGLDFIDEHKGLISAHTSNNQPPFNHQAGAQLTSDGGNIWNVIYSDSSLIDYSDCSWSDENTVFVASQFGIYKSTDLGNNWNKVKTFTDTIAGVIGVRQIDFVNSSVGYAVSFIDVYKTIDGGSNWNFVSNPALNVDPNNYIYWVRDLSFYDEMNGMISTREGVFVTNDGGYTWNAPTFKGNNANNHNLHTGCFGSATTLYFIGQRGIYQSLDGGITYELINHIMHKDITHIPSSIFMIDENTGFLSAYNYIISGDIGTTSTMFVKTSNGWKY